MRCEHHIVLSISKVKIIDLECWDQSQLCSDCVYPFWEVRSDECVLEIMWDTVMTNRASQRLDVVKQDR
jgi:hypothetical protein